VGLEALGGEEALPADGIRIPRLRGRGHYLERLGELRSENRDDAAPEGLEASVGERIGRAEAFVGQEFPHEKGLLFGVIPGGAVADAQLVVAWLGWPEDGVEFFVLGEFTDRDGSFVGGGGTTM
jgi:hypothetical protein